MLHYVTSFHIVRHCWEERGAPVEGLETVPAARRVVERVALLEAMKQVRHVCKVSSRTLGAAQVRAWDHRE